MIIRNKIKIIHNVLKINKLFNCISLLLFTYLSSSLFCLSFAELQPLTLIPTNKKLHLLSSGDDTILYVSNCASFGTNPAHLGTVPLTTVQESNFNNADVVKTDLCIYYMAQQHDFDNIMFTVVNNNSCSDPNKPCLKNNNGSGEIPIRMVIKSCNIKGGTGRDVYPLEDGATLKTGLNTFSVQNSANFSVSNCDKGLANYISY